MQVDCDNMLEFDIHEGAHYQLVKHIKEDLKQGKRVLSCFREFGIKAEAALFDEGWRRVDMAYKS